MRANNGTELVVVTAGSRFSFLKEKPIRVNEAVAKLNREGKKVINIVEGPVMPVGPFGTVVCEITIIWEKAESSVSRQNIPVGSAPVVNVTSENMQSVMTRIDLFLEDEEWEKADAYCEQALNYDPTNAVIYIKKLMVELKVKEQKMLMYYPKSFEANGNYQKAIRFGSEELKAELEGYINTINERIRREVEREANRRQQLLYDEAASLKSKAKTETEFKNAAEKFREILHFKDAKKQEALCLELAENARKDAVYYLAKDRLDRGINLETAIELFKSIPGWKDADELIEVCKVKSLEKKAADEEKSKKTKKIIKIVSPIIPFVVAFIIILNTVIIPGNNYKKAVAFMDDGKYAEAIVVFTGLGGYKDSAEKIKECQSAITDGKYNTAVSLMNEGKNAEAAIAFGKLGDYKDAKEKSFALWNEITDRATVSAGYNHTVALKSDGTVVAVGDNDGGECDVEGWTDIIAVSAGFSHTVGLKSDGTVVATEYTGVFYNGQCDVEGWTDIVAVSAGDEHTVGLKSDGTVVATEYTGDYYEGQCDVEGWTDIVAVSAGDLHTVGLKSDGTVVAVGSNYYGQCDVEGWTDIVAVSSVDDYIVGLKSDGTVVAVGSNYYGRCNVSGWTDIVAVSAGYDHTVGLKSDGTVVAVGSNSRGQCDVSSWTGIRLP